MLHFHSGYHHHHGCCVQAFFTAEDIETAFVTEYEVASTAELPAHVRGDFRMWAGTYAGRIVPPRPSRFAPPDSHSWATHVVSSHMCANDVAAVLTRFPLFCWWFDTLSEQEGLGFKEDMPAPACLLACCHLQVGRMRMCES